MRRSTKQDRHMCPRVLPSSVWSVLAFETCEPHERSDPTGNGGRADHHHDRWKARSTVGSVEHRRPSRIDCGSHRGRIARRPTGDSPTVTPGTHPCSRAIVDGNPSGAPKPLTLILDTSALVKRYLDEEGTPLVLARMADDPEWCASALALTEVHITLCHAGLASSGLSTATAAREGIRKRFPEGSSSRVLPSHGTTEAQGSRTEPGFRCIR